MKLPTSIIVIVIIIIMVLVGLVLFFYTTTGSKISEAEAERIFTEQCLDLCNQVKSQGITFLYSMENSYPRFIDACQIKYGTRAPNVCMGYCGNGCNIVATPQDALCLKSRAIPDSEEHCLRLQERPEYKEAGVSCDKCGFG